jgi:hypothetical protein
VPSGEIAAAGLYLVFINQQGEVVVAERSTGHVRARVAGALSGATPLASRGKVIYPAQGRLMIFELGPELPLAEPWLEWPAQAMDLPTVPLLLREARVYAFTPLGLWCLGGGP